MTPPGTEPAGPRLAIEPFDGTVTAVFSDAVIASSDDALIVRQGDGDPIFYFPFEDIYFEFLEKTGTTTVSPLLGEASHWRVSAVGIAADDVMWAYLSPGPEAALIAGHGAFDPAKVTIEAIPTPVRPAVG